MLQIFDFHFRKIFDNRNWKCHHTSADNGPILVRQDGAELERTGLDTLEVDEAAATNLFDSR